MNPVPPPRSAEKLCGPAGSCVLRPDHGGAHLPLVEARRALIGSDR